VGTLCVIDFKPRDFSQQQIVMLSKLGAIASSVLTLHKSCLGLERESTVRRPRDQDASPVANGDLLTGLANLKEFYRFASPHLDQAFATRGCALIIIDLDDLESVKEQWGRSEGDNYLRWVAKQLKSSIGEEDRVARLGGDAFAILLTDANEAQAVSFAERVLINLQTITEITGKPDLGRASIGLALAPAHGAFIDDIFKFAETALHSAKSEGGNRCQLYVPLNNGPPPTTANRHAEYRRALGAGEFIPYYQPKFELQKRTLAGFEALARWNTRTCGVLPPSEFLDLIENEELASRLTRSMLVQMARDLRVWQDLGLNCGSLAINACAGDFRNEDFADHFLRTVSDHDLQPRDFVLEVTERIVLEEHDKRLHDSLANLQKSGVIISLDDFGTGYAGLQHLRNWPVNQIKIDRMFVRDILRDSRDSAIVQSMIQMADAIGLSVTAEGVETSEQLELLRSLHCEIGQGDLFARPMPSVDVPDYVRKFSNWV
jgi:diguanylate cyclase (GGDEF)-like protein